MYAHITRCSRELLRDVVSPKLVPALIQGVIIGVVFVIVEVSFASFFQALLHPLCPGPQGCVFSEPLPSAL